MMNAPLTPDEYIQVMNKSAADRACRMAFQQLAVSLVPPGASLFDFGCGPGMDAKFYASRGLRVGAYDVDAGMCESFATHCASELATGAVHLNTGNYFSFLQQPAPAGGNHVRLITANFAPLNLVANPRELFAKFAAMLAPGGQVLASILNPFCAGDMRGRWWWRNVFRLFVRGSFSMPSPHGLVRRWLPHKLAEHAAPRFVVEAIYRGLPETDGADTLPRRLRMTSPKDWPSVTSCIFLFVLFRLTATSQ